MKQLLSNLRRSYAHAEAPAALKRLGKRKKAVDRGPWTVDRGPWTVDMLQLLLATGDESLAGVRDRALFAFAFASGGRRR